ncbi:hypothetical protein [Fodinicola feengrottensis]|uniref:hypothetical protein n=1 Tax=Fodinicola feengrottensis TaxID=435914 RepID=UPI0031D36212
MAEKSGRAKEKQRQYEEEFEAFLTYRYAVLLRFGYLLTGDIGAAEDMLDSALAGAYRHWRSTRLAGAEQVVRKTMLSGALSSWWRESLTQLTGWQGRRPLPVRAELPGAPASEEAEDLWHRLAGLPRLQRALMVLRYDENLELDAISELISQPPRRVTRLIEEALHSLAVREVVE